MPPPKKPKTKESWEEFISESQAESSVDKQGDYLGSRKTDEKPFNASEGTEEKQPFDCSYSFTRPKALLALVPEDLSKKVNRNGCLETQSNSIRKVLNETIKANGSVQILDRSSGVGHHPQLRKFLLQASSDPILPDVGENLVSSGAGSQDLQMTRTHPLGSPNSSKILWRNPSMQASVNELQPLAAFSTSTPSQGNSCNQASLSSSSSKYEREQNPGCPQIRPEESCRFRLGRPDQDLGSSSVARETWPRVPANCDVGPPDNDVEITLTERYSARQTDRPCDQDRSAMRSQAQTADSTTHVEVFSGNQTKRSRLNGERVQVRHQAAQPNRGPNSAGGRGAPEDQARGPTCSDRAGLGQGNSTPELSSSETKQMTIARLFGELHRKDIPVMEYLVSLDEELRQQPQGQRGGTAERILSQLLPRAFQSQTGGEFDQRKVEQRSVITSKQFPMSARPPLDSRAKMATLKELLCDDSGSAIVSRSSAAPSGEVRGVNKVSSGATHRLPETDDFFRTEDRGSWGVRNRTESIESENSCQIAAQANTDFHSSPEMPSSSSSNERGRNKADEKGVCRCQICDDVASGFHYGVWSCEGCKAFFKRSLHGPVDYVCPATNNCTIDKLRRKSCQACRLRKCHEAGMTAGMNRKEKVTRPTGKKRKAGEEELSTSDPDAASSSCFGKLTRYDSVESSHDATPRPDLSPGREMKHSPSSFPASPSNPAVGCRDSPQPNPLVERLLAIELPAREAEFNTSLTNSSLHLLSGLLGLLNSQLIDIITWSKALPDFSKSSLESRTRLLVASWSELLILGTVWQSVPQPNAWVCAPNLHLTRANCKVALIESLFDRIMLLVQTFRRLQLTKTELVLLRLTILLNSDSSVIESQPPLANLRNLLDETWQQTPALDDVAKSSRSRLSHVLLTLPDIRQCSLMMQDVINYARHRQGVPTYSLLHEMLDCDAFRTPEMRASNAGTAGVE